VKLDPDPAIVAGRFFVDEETYGAADFVRRDPGKMLRSLRRKLRGNFSEELKRGRARNHLSIGQRNSMLTEKRGRYAISIKP
jgi:hypothetical protein